MSTTKSGCRRVAVAVSIICWMSWASGVAPARAEDHGKDLDRAQAQADLDKALADGATDRALELAEAIATHEQAEYFDSLVQLAAIHCKRGDKERAIDTVKAGLDAGFWDYRRLLNDESLALINRDQSFQEMVRGAWAKQYIAMLERDSRDEMQKPHEIMKTLSFKAGERVADVGAGSGYFTIPIARAVGPKGKVWAVDIRQQMLDFITNRLETEGLGNVEPVLAKPDDPLLPAAGVDTILMVDTIHYIQNRAAYGEKLSAALAPGGRLVIIDFRYDPDAKREFAPPIEQQVPRKTLDADLAEAGFEVVASYDFLPEQYFVVYSHPG
jgi:ubiquinone/menaquinone biosynthesis C-methylase UbiE